MPDSIGSVYYGQVAGGKNRNVGETAFECFEISGQGISTDCPRGGWSVFLRIRCIEEKP